MLGTNKHFIEGPGGGRGWQGVAGGAGRGPARPRPVPAQSAEQFPQHSLSTEGWLLPRGTQGHTLRGAYSHSTAPAPRDPQSLHSLPHCSHPRLEGPTGDLAWRGSLSTSGWLKWMWAP